MKVTIFWRESIICSIKRNKTKTAKTIVLVSTASQLLTGGLNRATIKRLTLVLVKQRVNMKLSQYNNAMNELQRTGSLSRITDYLNRLVFKKREMRSASVLINKWAQYI